VTSLTLGDHGSYATQYASQWGWAILPIHTIKDGICTCGRSDCGSPGKHPLTPNGLTDATKDQQVITDWWKQWPEANIGVRTGQVSGIIAIDLDVKDDEVNGISNWYDLEDTHGRVHTMTARTGSGGEHWIYKLPDGVEVRNDAGTKLAKGIDIRGDGGYIVVAPSLHISGESYEWEDERPPSLAPEWLIKQCANPAQRPSVTIAKPAEGYAPWVSEALQGVGESYRNQTAARLVGYFHKQGLAEDIIYAVLTPFAEACNPPMDIRELRRTVASVSRYERQIIDHHIVDPPDFQEVAGQLVYTWQKSGVCIKLDEMVRDRDGIHCELEIEAIMPGRQTLDHGPIRFNLSSTTTRNGLVKYLGGQMPELAWPTMMDTVCRLAIAHFKVGPSLINLAHYEGFPPNWLLWPLILEDEINILFGDGGNGKSLIAMAAAVSLQTQNSLLSGMVPNGNTKTLYLDWEASPNAHANRLKKLMHPVPMLDMAYLRCSAPLHEIVRQVKRHLNESGCNMVIIDSIAAACGGEPERADIALRLCNAVRSLDTTALLIGHQTKGNDDTGKPFGSVFWTNEARSTMEIKRQQDAGQDTMNLGLYHRKINDGRLEKPLGISVSFSDDTIRFGSQSIVDVPELASRLPAKEVILRFLMDNGPSSVEEIVAATDRKVNTVHKVFSDHRDMFVVATDSNGNQEPGPTLYDISDTYV
jgi:hypothetical protein